MKSQVTVTKEDQIVAYIKSNPDFGFTSSHLASTFNCSRVYARMVVNKNKNIERYLVPKSTGRLAFYYMAKI